MAEGRPSWSQEWTERRNGSQVAGPGETFELYAAGCVVEPLPIKLSVKSSLLTDAFDRNGCFLGTMLCGRGQGWDGLAH